MTRTIETENKLGKALRLLRVFHDVKAYDLAERMKTTGGWISSLEGGRKNPNLATLAQYAVIFNTTIGKIMKFSEEVDRIPKSRKDRVRFEAIKFVKIFSK